MAASTSRSRVSAEPSIGGDMAPRGWRRRPIVLPAETVPGDEEMRCAALQVTRHGDPIEVLAVNDVDVPVPEPGEVLIGWARPR